jgi:hypothetical protein
MIKVYYGPKNTSDEAFRLLPAPLISINTNYSYSNDHIIGYTYTVSLNGYVTNYRRPDNESELDNNSDFHIRSIRQVLQNVETTKNILSVNGGSLTVTQSNGSSLLSAEGGNLKSLNFDSSDNKMTTYSKFTAEIEFNELSIGGEQFGCSSSYIDSNTLPSSDLVNINQYKIKEFTDNWNIDVSDEAFNFVQKSDNDSNLEVKNSIINVSYSVSATGRDFVTSNSSGESLLSPGWIQAKNFVQDRIYKQVSQFDQILKLSNGTTCATTDTLNQINSYGDGAYKSLYEEYKFYNELINFEASVSNGSFSATYTAILKLDNDDDYSASNVIHTFSKENSFSSSSTGPDQTTINISGEIRGLIEGGLISSGGTLSLGQSGSVLITQSNNSAKFNNANDFVSKIIDIDNNDLKQTFKDALDISYDSLNLREEQLEECELPQTIPPASFNLTKNFMEGIITYSASYNSIRSCGKDGDLPTISRTTISVDAPEKIYNEFIIPGAGYLVQFLNTKTAKKINVDIEGRAERDCCAAKNNDSIKLPDFSTVIPVIGEDTILNQQNINYNPIDGSYRISLAYTCGVPCKIYD